MYWKILVIFTFSILISACAQQTEENQSQLATEQIEQDLFETENLDNLTVNHDLVDSEWYLNSLDGEPLIKGTNIILAFDRSSFSGFAGCNGYGGPVETDEDGNIKFGEMSSQAEGCIEPEGVLDQEINYLNQLLTMKKYHVENGELSLSIREDEKTLVYTLREPSNVNPEILENTHWKLLASDDFPLVEGSLITISFSEGKMEGFAGCRDYQGEYEVEGDKIRFPMTMMLNEVCDDENLLIQEGKFTTAFELATHYQVQDDQLILSLATGETLIFEHID